MSASPLLLELDNVVVGYDRAVTRPLSLQLRRGELVALCGANGVGKSSVLGAIQKRVHCFSGTIRMAENVRIGALDQQSPWPHQLPLSGRDLLMLAGLPAAALPDSLQPCLNQRLDRLSGGQRQLLRTWVVLHQPADLLLLDEPTNNLDPESERLLAEALRHRRGDLAVLLVSHEQHFIDSLPARCVEMR
jgi:ATPase subunit of ABC transporter with duplicated ATPase domains